MFKKSRIGKMVVACTLILALVTPMVGFADNTAGEIPEVRPEKGEGFLDVVEMYAPETLSDWQAMEEQRKSLIEDIQEVREDIKELKVEKVEERKGSIREHLEGIRDGFKEEAEQLQAELNEKAKNGEITREEAQAQLKEFKESQKEKAQAKREEIKGKVEEWKAVREDKLEQWKEEHQDKIDSFNAQKEEIKTLKEELKTAVAADDAEAVKAVLDELYSEMKQVNNFLANRLEWIKDRYNEMLTMEDIVLSDEI